MTQQLFPIRKKINILSRHCIRALRMCSVESCSQYLCNKPNKLQVTNNTASAPYLSLVTHHCCMEVATITLSLVLGLLLHSSVGGSSDSPTPLHSELVTKLLAGYQPHVVPQKVSYQPYNVLLLESLGSQRLLLSTSSIN